MAQTSSFVNESTHEDSKYTNIGLNQISYALPTSSVHLFTEPHFPENKRHFQRKRPSKNQSSPMTAADAANFDDLPNNVSSVHGSRVTASPVAGSRGDVAGEDLSDSRMRLVSFRCWMYENVQAAAVLVAAGFYHTGKDDKVKCYSCLKVFFNWEITDDAWFVHAKWSPKCSHVIQVKGKGYIQQVLRMSVTNNHEYSHDGGNLAQMMEQLSIERHNEKKAAKHEDFKDENVRRSTYRNWRFGHIQNPKKLAQAGFFFSGEADRVTCYMCGFMLHNWEVTDEPWHEHAKWNPQCPLVLDRETVNNPNLGVTARETNSMDMSKGDSEYTNDITTGLADDTNKVKSDIRSECKICMSKEVEILFLPCGHLVCCMECANRVSHCPLCRKFIRGTVKVYW